MGRALALSSLPGGLAANRDCHLTELSPHDFCRRRGPPPAPRCSRHLPTGAAPAALQPAQAKTQPGLSPPTRQPANPQTRCGSLEALLPEQLSGADFLEAHPAGNGDSVTRVDPDKTYAVRAPVAHAVFEHFRVQARVRACR